MARQERREGQGSAHHGPGGSQAWVGAVHEAEMDLAFVVHGCPAHQVAAALDQADPNPFGRQR
jgi:hypothetical protein